MQRQCIRVPIRAGSEERVIRFVRGLAARRPEVLDALSAEGISSEIVFIDRQGERSALLIYTAGEDLVASNRKFELSQLAVDREFRSLMADGLDLAGATVVEVALAVP